MMRTVTDEQSVRLAELLILMNVPKEMCLEIMAVLETTEMLHYFLDILAARNYDMTPEEVYEASVETTLTFQLGSFG